MTEAERLGFERAIVPASPHGIKFGSDRHADRPRRDRVRSDRSGAGRACDRPGRLRQTFTVEGRVGLRGKYLRCQTFVRVGLATGERGLAHTGESIGFQQRLNFVDKSLGVSSVWGRRTAASGV